MNWNLTILVMVCETVRTVTVALLEGRDSNHVSYQKAVPKDTNRLLVGPEYHTLHHVDPEAYISSCFKVFDWVMGTACTLRGKRVALVGFDDRFSGILGGVLEGERVARVDIPGPGMGFGDGARWENTDILVLGPACEGAEVVIELFRKIHDARAGSLLLPEVWDFCPGNNVTSCSWNGAGESPRERLRRARKHYGDPNLVYRHIVISASFGNRMLGSGAGGGERQVVKALWWVKRGARYVPAEYTLSALWEYLEFLNSSPTAI